MRRKKRSLPRQPGNNYSPKHSKKHRFPDNHQDQTFSEALPKNGALKKAIA
ncbi:hypothetical protein [Okeania sp. KiyG1]|uniref:hypothetical protein n=1 Tax=Okeania sp. KiyG1 TaxID=2720165 RepID=UPI001920BFBE|nr:hypothetical protein [Okeania sp. KiyG1]